MKITGTKRYIWDAPKERQIQYLNYLFSRRSTTIDKSRYRVIKNIFQSASGIKLDDLDTTARKRLIMKLFYFKFKNSCSNAKYVRAGKKKGYENVKFLLGEWSSIIRNLKKYRPDLVELGIEICRKYIESGFAGEYAPVVHRIGGKGTDYEWNNITIIAKKEHDELTKKERQGQNN
ncbi:hypothetical protein [Parageobacillus thermoglucosidasius]|uniref:Uncharacterized protein n=3 Tax=Anoxybacillaceae TaxID=3120669 RepID=A0AAN0YRH4_PARTM|nr:hypothetical protein [Parageobacillus thermoglucosidasius]ALF11931.1 hypothetical protein AOT13_18870 [Parageobacillus thermoglucosidasius]ANZ32015.1 hypothetical protein BCV53_18935 [Parageobacillus thermoglucosidasius]APM82749.1 hypothetical protein BCV54_18950 [Parageobacillus thermoglucosidasius]KJX67180.1 hypothetical protein WH82_19285 [Parageobacillus thermoglucosidasius]RDE26489.1 hypothetical protein DV712_06215 [Parageobacillus thermoglucosidasius]